MLAFVIAAILTPTPDIINQLLMAAPLIILYEVGIIAVRLLVRKAPAAPAEVVLEEVSGGGTK